jgi:chemotaxis response regulator CheB
LERLRIIVVDMPRLVRDMIERAIVAEPDMALSAVLESPRQLAQVARAERPHFVILGITGKTLPTECREMLSEQPTIRLLGIEATAGDGHLYELRPHREPLGEITPSHVVAAIRAAAQRPPFTFDLAAT